MTRQSPWWTLAVPHRSAVEEVSAQPQEVLLGSPPLTTDLRLGLHLNHLLTMMCIQILLSLSLLWSEAMEHHPYPHLQDSYCETHSDDDAWSNFASAAPFSLASTHAALLALASEPYTYAQALKNPEFGL